MQSGNLVFSGSRARGGGGGVAQCSGIVSSRALRSFVAPRGVALPAHRSLELILTAPTHAPTQTIRIPPRAHANATHCDCHCTCTVCTAHYTQCGVSYHPHSVRSTAAQYAAWHVGRSSTPRISPAAGQIFITYFCMYFCVFTHVRSKS